MNKLFQVVSHERDTVKNLLIVDIGERMCQIPLSQFEKWVDESDRLFWVNDYSDHNGEHVQELGKYTIEQYWELGWRFIHNDIYDFIVIHFVNPFKGIQQAIKVITDEYAEQH